MTGVVAPSRQELLDSSSLGQSRTMMGASASHSMSTRSSNGPLATSRESGRPGPATGLAIQLPSSPRVRLARKRAASINVQEANNSHGRGGTATALSSPSPGSNTICLCTPAPKVPRPRNAFILYRQHHQAQVVAQHPGLANPEISKIIGEQWRDQPDEVKDGWKSLAEEEKARHHKQYPDYRYQPRRGPRGGGGGARAPSSSGAGDDASGRCPKCGGRYIATPRTPSTPFATPTASKPAAAAAPAMHHPQRPQPTGPFPLRGADHPSPRDVELEHRLRQHSLGSASAGSSGGGGMGAGGSPRGRPVRSYMHPQQQQQQHRHHSMAIPEMDEDDYDMLSPPGAHPHGHDPKRRRFDHPGGGFTTPSTPGHRYAEAAPSPSSASASHHPHLRHLRTPSLPGPQQIGFGPAGRGTMPFPGPFTPRGSSMAPPPRPSLAFASGPAAVAAAHRVAGGAGPPSQQQGTPRAAAFEDPSLRLPPLQTHLVPAGRGDGGVVLPHHHQHQQQQSQQMMQMQTQQQQQQQPPAGRDSTQQQQQRGIEAMVMSIPYVNKLKVLDKISPPLAAPGPGSPARETRGAVVAVEGAGGEALNRQVAGVLERVLRGSGECVVRVWEDGGRVDGEGAGAGAVEGGDGEGGEGKTGGEAGAVVLRGPGAGETSLPAEKPFGAYLATIMAWHAKSEAMIKHITTLPSAAPPLPPPTTPPPTTTTATTTTSTTTDGPEKPSAPASAPARRPLLPIALVSAGFSMTISDRFACRVPIADSYAPVDHWQWMATLWRGIVGPDLVVYVRRATAEEVGRLGGVEFKMDGVMVVRVNEETGLDEKTTRRLGFEVLEWVRAGGFREGFGGGL